MSVDNSALHPTTGHILDPTPIEASGNPADGAVAGDREAVLHAFLHEADDHQGGLPGLLDQMRNNGLGGHLNQWAQGNPQEITADDVGQGLGETILSAIATRANVSVRVATDALSSFLPRLIEQVAPGGKPAAPVVAGMASRLASEVL